MQTTAILLNGAGDVACRNVALIAPGSADLVVDIAQSGISTGTEKLFFTGAMPPFPGMAYPLVPGYEAVGEVVEAGPETDFRVGERVFVPGADCFDGVRGLFGGAANRIVTKATRVARIDPGFGAQGALLALAATAYHALAGGTAPDLIVGHGTLGRLLARIAIAKGHQAPTVWEIDAARRDGDHGYPVIAPEADETTRYTSIYDASGNAPLLDTLVGKLARGGEITLAGFYEAPLTFAFPPAFLCEARMRVAAEWQADDLTAARDMVESGALSLDGLITHRMPAGQAQAAYDTAFSDPACLKMILDWEGTA